MGPDEKYIIYESDHYQWFALSFTQESILKLVQKVREAIDH